MLKRLLIAAILAVLAIPAYGAGLYPLSRQQIFKGGKVSPGARLFLYDGGTTTPRVGYRDLALTTAHPNPIVADADGRLPLVYLADGYYRQRLTTSTGTLIFDDDGIPVLTTSAGGSGTTVDPDSVFKTRDIKIRFDDQPVAGYVRLNGRTIGSASSGATERANSDTQSLYEELWSFANITVTGGKGASAAADFAANKPLVLPDMAGRLIAGMDDLGAGAAGRLTSGLLGSDPTLAGGTGGAQTVTIGATNLPVTSPWGITGTVSGTTSLESANHAHSFSATTNSASAFDHTHNYTKYGALTPIQQGGGAGVTVWTGEGGATTNSGGVDHTHTVAGTTGLNSANHTHNFSASISASPTSNGGGGQPTNKLPPLMTLMIFIRL